MRISCFLLVLSLVVFAGVVAADEIYVPANKPSVGSGNAWPWQASSYKEWRYQLLLTASQLQNKGGLITDIAFAPTSTGVHTATAFEMSMSHTTQTALVSTWALNLPNPVVVHAAGPHTRKPVKDTWSPVGMLTPFLYDGKSNLVIDIRYKGGAMSQGFGGSCHSDGGLSVTILRSWDNRTGAYTGTTALSANRNLGLITRVTLSATTILGSGSPSVGGTITLNLSSPQDAGRAYQVGTSLGTGPIQIGNRLIRLDVDKLLEISVRDLLPTIFQNYAGRLDASGKAQASIRIPADARLVGTRLHSVFLTIDPAAPFGVSSISDPFTFTISK